MGLFRVHVFFVDVLSGCPPFVFNINLLFSKKILQNFSLELNQKGVQNEIDSYGFFLHLILCISV